MVTNSPWERRLKDNPDLGQRIRRAFTRVARHSTAAEAATPLTVRLDASQSPDALLADALFRLNESCVWAQAAGAGEGPGGCCGSGSGSGGGSDGTGGGAGGGTVVIMGTHCAGKKTVGEALARRLGCVFEGELGDVLRGEHSALVPLGHLHGDGTAAAAGGGEGAAAVIDTGVRAVDKETKAADEKTPCAPPEVAWDDRVYRAEKSRDYRQRSQRWRVVETWHLGNLAWARSRGTSRGCTAAPVARSPPHQREQRGQGGQGGAEGDGAAAGGPRTPSSLSEDSAGSYGETGEEGGVSAIDGDAVSMLRRHRDAFAAVVAEAEWRMGRGQQLLVVFLDVEQTTVLRRRGEVAHNRARLPMGGDGADEAAEVGRLHYFLSEDARRLLAGAGVPYLSLRNDKDGEAAVEGRVARILDALRVV